MSAFSPTELKPHRQPSFVGLPPISPGPEFGSALGISTADLDAYDGHQSSSPSPPAQSPSPHSSPSYIHGRAGNHNGAGPVSIMNQLQSSSPPPSQGQFMHGQYMAMQSPQGHHPVAHPYPPGAQFSVNGNVNGNGNGNGNGMHQQPSSPPVGHDGQPGVFASRQAMKAPIGYQQFAPGPQGSPPGMPSPSLMSNGQFVLPPGWKVESSQLQQPLTSPRHRPSPSVSSLRQQRENYGIEKETGAPSARSVSPPTHSPVDTRRPGQPALVQSGGQSSQNGFAPPNPPFLQQQQHHQGPALARTSTNVTQDSQYPDEHDGRRSSNMFSSIRSRLAGNGNERRDSMGSRPQGNGVTGDGVSDASIPIDEQGRVASPTFGLRGNGQPMSDLAPRPSQDTGGSPPPGGVAPFSPPKEKRSLFTRPSGLGSAPSSSQDIRRPSTAEGATSFPPVGFGPGQPKKRFSKLTGMLNRDKPEAQPSQAQGYPALMQGHRPSLSENPMGISNQLGLPGGPVGGSQMAEYGRPRSATAGSRPSISEQGRGPSAQGFASPSAMGAIIEEERGRKPSGGNFLAGIFGKRSESKTREQRPPHSPPGLGQPQGMNPQGQMVSMHRPGQSGSFLPIQGQTIAVQGQQQMLPPQGQYQGLAQQVQAQQQFLGQPGRQGMPNNQAFLQGQNPAQFGGNQQGQPSPGISPITQTSGSPLTTQPPGGVVGQQSPYMQQGPQGYIPQRPQGQQQPLGIVQVATAVPIRQVGNSPNSNTGQLSAGNSPGGQSDSSRQRSASVVNQIEVGGIRKQNVDMQGFRNRAASQSVLQQQQQPQHLHIASLQAPVRKPLGSTSPRNSAQFRQQDAPSADQNQNHEVAFSTGQRGTPTPPQDSPQTTRGTQGLAPGHQHNDSVQSTPRASPAPNLEQQNGPPRTDPSRGSGSAQLPWQNPGSAGQPSSISQQPSVYRPSGPQVAAVVQSFSQQQPQSPWSVGRQNVPGQPGQPGQPFPPGQSPQNMMMTPPPQDQRSEKEGTFSKLIGKSKTFVYQMSEPQPSAEKSKSEKESKGVKGMLGAFKRDKAKPQQQPEVGKAPPGGPQWSIQPGQAPPNMQQQQLGQGPQEPQTPQRPPQMQMPPKAQQVMGIGEGEQKIVSTPDEVFQPQSQAPQNQSHVQPSPVQPRPEHQGASSQPYLNNQRDRQSPPKTSQPFLQQQSLAQPAQQPSGRSPISASAPDRTVPAPTRQQQQEPAQQASGQNRPQAAATAVSMRAHNLKQQIASHAPEPQYAPVPIPQGYNPVYGEGMAAKPEMIRAQSYGQPYPGIPYQAHPQQWVYPGMMPGQLPPGAPPHMVQQGWPQYPPYQGTPPPMMMAQYPPPAQPYFQGQHNSPSPPLQGQAPPPQMPLQQPGSQPPMHPQIMAPTTGQIQTVPPQQAVILPQSPGFAPQQSPPVSSDQTQAIPNNGQPVAPQSPHQFAVMSGAAPAPVDTSNDAPPQTQSTESLKPQPVPAPNQTVPRSDFSVVKPVPGQDQLQPPQDNGGNLVPQRQLSGASEVSSLTSAPATSHGSAGAHSDHTVSQAQMSTTISQRSAESPVLSYERAPVTLRDEGPRAGTPTTSASTERDDIYGATPRQSVHATPAPSQEQHIVEHFIVSEPAHEPPAEPEAKFAGPLPNNRSPETNPTFKVEPPPQQGFVVDAPPVTVETALPSPSHSQAPVVTSKSPSPDDEDAPSPTESELGRKKAGSEGSAVGEDGKATVNGKPVQSSQEIFEEHKRKQLLRDMEEKIALNPTESEMLDPRMMTKKKEDDAPMMSATSYPGQEWNPYGEGWIEDEF